MRAAEGSIKEPDEVGEGVVSTEGSTTVDPKALAEDDVSVGFEADEVSVTDVEVAAAAPSASVDDAELTVAVELGVEGEVPGGEAPGEGAPAAGVEGGGSGSGVEVALLSPAEPLPPEFPPVLLLFPPLLLLFPPLLSLPLLSLSFPFPPCFGSSLLSSSLPEPPPSLFDVGAGAATAAGVAFSALRSSAKE